MALRGKMTFKDKYAKKAHEITQKYIESFGAQFTNIDDLDDAIASALREATQQGMKEDELCPNCGKDYFVEETIIDGELGCSCGGLQIVIDEDFAKRILDYLESVTDSGPTDEGWKSDSLENDINALVDLLGLPSSRRWK